MLKSGWSDSINWRLALLELGSFFFQPLKLHLEPTNLFIEFVFLDRLFSLFLPIELHEHLRPVPQELLLPFANQRRVYIMLTGQFADRVHFSHRSQRHPKLELGAVLTSFRCHLSSLHVLDTAPFPSLARGPVIGDHYTGQNVSR